MPNDFTCLQNESQVRIIQGYRVNQDTRFYNCEEWTIVADYLQWKRMNHWIRFYSITEWIKRLDFTQPKNEPCVLMLLDGRTNHYAWFYISMEWISDNNFTRMTNETIKWDFTKRWIEPDEKILQLRWMSQMPRFCNENERIIYIDFTI